MLSFSRQVVSVRIEIEMPDYEFERDAKAVRFAMKIHSPVPGSVKINENNMCIIQILPGDV